MNREENRKVNRRTYQLKQKMQKLKLFAAQMQRCSDEFDAILEVEKLLHPSVLSVVEQSPTDTSDAQEYVNLLQMGDFKVKTWSTHDGQSARYGTRSGEGGTTIATTDTNGSLEIFLRIQVNPENVGDLAPIVKLGILLHEMGHVDDMENGVNFRDGHITDLEAAELYAHQYCCRRFHELQLGMGIASYCSIGLAQHLKAQDSIAASAAEQFIRSQEYAEFYRVAMPYRKQWPNIPEPVHIKH